MRHLGSIALSIVLTPIIYVLLGYGLVKLPTGVEGIDKWTNIGIGAAALLAAGGAYAALIMPKLSPLGPILGGLIFFVVAVLEIASPSTLLKILKPSILDGALLPPIAVSLFLCVPLFGTIFSPRRWRGPDPQGAAVATGYPGYAMAGQSANPYAAPADQYAAGNPYASQSPYPTYPPQDPYAAGAAADTPYPGPMAAPAPAPTAVMPQAQGAPEHAGYGAPASGYPTAMPGSPAPSTYASPGYPSGMPGSPTAMPGSPTAMPGSPSAMPGSPLPPVAPVAGASPTMPIAHNPPAATPMMPHVPTGPGEQDDMFARTQLVHESDLPGPAAPSAPPATHPGSAPPVYGTPQVASAPPVSGGSTGNVYGQPAAAHAEPVAAPVPNLYGQAATPPGAGEHPAPAGNVYGQPGSTGNVYGQPGGGTPDGDLGPAQPHVYGQPAAPEQISPAAPAGPIYPAPNQIGQVAAPDNDKTVVDAPMPPAGPAHPRPE